MSEPEDMTAENGEQDKEKAYESEKEEESQHKDTVVKNEEKEKESRKTSRPQTSKDKKSQQMLAEIGRLKREMTENRLSIKKPQVKPYTPDIFNSLSPYYNTYLLNFVKMELDAGENFVPRTGYGHRATALGTVDPEVSWRMDHVPGPIETSRIPGTLFRPKVWAKHMPGHEKGSTRLPPLPHPCVPKFSHPEFQPNKMNYDVLQKFRMEMRNMHESLSQKKSREDYERTVNDWHRMNLSELKELPPQSRYHVKRAIFSYLGTSQGSNKALRPLAKQLEAES